MVKKFKILLLLFLIFFAYTAFSLPGRIYDVQVLIFSHITPDTLQSEKWPALSSDVLNAFNQNTSIQPAAHPASQLAREKNLLEKNPHYKILLDSSWRETWTDDQSTIVIPIAGGNFFDNDWQLKGIITIALSRYFDVNTSLLLTEPTSILQKMDVKNYFSHWDQPTFSFKFMQNRRMRSDELNYLGYPLMGVLIKIIP